MRKSGKEKQEQAGQTSSVRISSRWAAWSDAVDPAQMARATGRGRKNMEIPFSAFALPSPAPALLSALKFLLCRSGSQPRLTVRAVAKAQLGSARSGEINAARDGQAASRVMLIMCSQRACVPAGTSTL